jgi:hypothetical protein
LPFSASHVCPRGAGTCLTPFLVLLKLLSFFPLPLTFSSRCCVCRPRDQEAPHLSLRWLTPALNRYSEQKQGLRCRLRRTGS